MRVISGSLKSRLFKAPRAYHSRPMGDRVKMALFNMLVDLQDLTVLDAYAGCGSLAFEAVSRGAREAVCLESDRKTYQTLVDNVQKLGLEEVLRYRLTNALSYAQNSDELFDLVFFDPPYDKIDQRSLDIISAKVKVPGRLVVSYPKHFKPALNKKGWLLSNSRCYGHACLDIYERLKY